MWPGRRQCREYGRGYPPAPARTDSIGLTVTLITGTEPVFLSWRRTSGGTSGASPAVIGCSFPPRMSTPEPSVMKARCSQGCTWSGVDSPGSHRTYSLT